MGPAIEFEQQGFELLLRYSPRDDDSWVHDRFVRGDELVIKRTFHLRKEHLVTDHSPDTYDNDQFYESEPLRFRVATLEGEYFSFDPKVLPIGYPLLIHHQAPITWK
ncbi:MAG TPA: hypothetical protein PLZ37_18285, partial [Nitrospira sp.]|nr:hypothetical protein [Nitrospira sp.]